jgi:hypothetical protein
MGPIHPAARTDSQQPQHEPRLLVESLSRVKSRSREQRTQKPVRVTRKSTPNADEQLFVIPFLIVLSSLSDHFL